MNAGTIVPTPHYIELRFTSGKLAARYDPVRGILELSERGVKQYFDLTLVELPVEKNEQSCYNFDS